jgi:halocyanin-like protein
MVDTTESDRRTVLATAAGLAAASLAGCSASSRKENDSSTDFDGWFEDVSNYDGVADRTGQTKVEVTVGAKGNGGNMAFAPAGLRVSPGTTVVWTWTGAGNMHNVVADDGAFESEMRSAEGATFEHTFERTGTFEYYCAPHESAGMKGAVVVE